MEQGENEMEQVVALEQIANKLRIESIRATTAAGSGHPTSCMSIAEIMSTLFFSELGTDDEFILSKGHAAPILWAAYAETGCISEEELMTLRRINSPLEGHPTPNMPLIQVATGSLGQGLSAGVGMALAKRITKSNSRIYVVLGDGECAEGSVWEAANTAAYYRLSNVCAIVDANRLGQSQETMHGRDVEVYRRKFEAFGWNSKVIDGHSVPELLKAYGDARKSDKPFAIIARTLKGKGVSFLEDKEGWHGKPLGPGGMKKALDEIGEVKVKIRPNSNLCLINRRAYMPVLFKSGIYKKSDYVATRTAFGDALVTLGRMNRNVVAIDADVRNSVMTGPFFREFPGRSFQAFIAEQNMVGMSVGFSAMGYMPFVSTFATFLTRAHDFIRMAHYSGANVKLVGSHAGVSIGPDGPSQMGLEDIPMFLNIPGAQVLYPSDAVSTQYLVGEMARYDGISYLRTTREKTPILYGKDEKFPAGGLKVLRKSDNDRALVISAGITLHEAHKAYDYLRSNGINIRVIDLYSLQPVDSASLVKNANECNGNVVVVEDHYCNAMGSLISGFINDVRTLCVSGIPRSGKPHELLHKYGIDSDSIIKMVEQF